MNVTLSEITPQNFDECIDLKVAGAQTGFVASNLYSIAQTKVYPEMESFAVYDDEQMVGFVMFGFSVNFKRYLLVRLMIDERFQGKGYGRAATLEVIERMRQIEDCREIYLSCVPENTNAERLYKSIGFERTGEINEGGEILMRFAIDNNANPKSAI
jgi:diamine N-acetyltransferase